MAALGTLLSSSSSSCFILLLCITPLCLGLPSNPPLGNSIALSATTSEGTITYSCQDGAWLPVSVSATLVRNGDGHKPVGSYLQAFPFQNTQQGSVQTDENSTNAGVWTLLNSDGDAAESGHPFSLVAGKVISTSATSSNDSASCLRSFLAQASMHQFDGEAARVSYIMQQNAVSDQVPQARCSQDHSYTLNLTYKADYIFWKQDMVPPAPMPSEIAVDSHTEQPIEAFFATGTAVYQTAEEDGGDQAFQGAEGTLYDVPGGVKLGYFHMNDTSMCLWTAAGASKYAITCATPSATIVVDSGSLPWFLMRVSKSAGNLVSLGPPSSIQMLSTYGGVAPSAPPSTTSTTCGVNQGAFTAIIWIYAYQQ